MSTNGFYGFKKDGRIRATYNHMDSYPTWLGTRLGEFIRDTPDLLVFTTQLMALPVVNEDDKPSKAQRAQLNKVPEVVNPVKETDDWYEALRILQGDPRGMVAAGYWIDMGYNPLTQTNRGLEWGYIVDVDDGTLDIYRQLLTKPTLPVKVCRLTFEELRVSDVGHLMLMVQG